MRGLLINLAEQDFSLTWFKLLVCLHRHSDDLAQYMGRRCKTVVDPPL